MNLLKYWKLKFCGKSYLRLLNCINPPNTEKYLLQLGYTTKGYNLEEAFRHSSIDILFGNAVFNNKIEDIIIIDLKYSGFELSDGRYIIYKIVKKDRIYHINWWYKISRKIPNHFVETRSLSGEEFGI